MVTSAVLHHELSAPLTEVNMDTRELLATYQSQADDLLAQAEALELQAHDLRIKRARRSWKRRTCCGPWSTKTPRTCPT